MIKNNLLLIYISVTIALLSSCKEENKRLKEVNYNVLKGNIIKLDSILGIPSQIEVSGSILIINDTFNGKLGSIFSLKDYSLLARFGTLGEGPNEITPPIYHFLNDDKTLSIYSRSSNELLKYRIESPFIFEKDMITSEIKLKSSMDKIISINDSTYIGTGITNDKKRYSLLTNYGKSTQILDLNYPNNNSSKLPYEFNFLAFQANLSLKPDKKAFVTASIFCKQFEIISISETNEISKTYELNDFELHYTDNSSKEFKQISFLEEQEAGFINVSSTNEYIYLLYSGRKKGEFKSRALLGNHIWIYDWSGKKVIEYTLDQDIIDLAINKENNILYGLIVDKSPTIVTYKLTIP